LLLEAIPLQGLLAYFDCFGGVLGKKKKRQYSRLKDIKEAKTK
jgi:hypothetical protein